MSPVTLYQSADIACSPGRVTAGHDDNLTVSAYDETCFLCVLSLTLIGSRPIEPILDPHIIRTFQLYA